MGFPVSGGIQINQSLLCASNAHRKTVHVNRTITVRYRKKHKK